MRYFTLITFILLAILPSMAQVDVCGIIVELGTNEPLVGASIILRNPEGKIKKYATSDAQGLFTISTQTVAGYTLDISMLSFAKQSLRLDSISFPFTVEMIPETTMLKEVSVKADRIREQGDTITYLVGSFAQAQDHSIGDVLNRMPGIDVSESGKIQYQGEDINRFYIEGSDLLGGKYGVATNGISHEDVGVVEVMENHQPMQVLSGISFSDQAAINIKLKDRAKATWTFHGDAGVGYSWQPNGLTWDGELFAMAVMPSFQNIFTIKTNNIGENLDANTTDFFAQRRATGLSPYVSVSLMEQPPLKLNRFLFNRSAIISSNSLWKVGSGEVKAQIDYSYNYATAQASNITTYFLNDGNRVVTENRNGHDRTHSLSGKFIYETNQKTAFINNTLQTNIDWDNLQLNISGSIGNHQSASLPDYYIANKFKMIKRFKEKHLVTFISNNEWESMPQTLTVSRNNDFLRQSIGDNAFYTHESAAYSFVLKGFNIGLEGGVKGYHRSFNSQLPDLPGTIPGETTNVLNTGYLTLYVTPKIEYWVKKVNITLNAPLSIANYSFDKALANRSEFYFSPSLKLSWKPTTRFTFGLNGGVGRSPMSLNLIQPGYIMSNYRTFRSGVDDFYITSSQNVSVNFSYKHSRRGIFANGMLMHLWNHTPYTLAQQLYGDYIVYSYSSAKSTGKSLIANGNIGKTLDFMRGSASINASYNRSENTIISETSDVNSISSGWSIGAKINGSPAKWLSIDYAFNYSENQLLMNDLGSPWLASLDSKLLLNIIPHRRWQWHLVGEFYRNEINDGNYKNFVLFDTKIVYNLTKRLELSASVNNILDRRTYSYTQYSQLSSFESTKWLRGREFLISITIRK